MNAREISVPVELIRRAYAGTSFDPEGRGARTVQGYNSELQDDIEQMQKHADKAGTQALLEEQVSQYVAGYQRRVIALLHSESRCVSSFIVGPSKFPARRMEKRFNVVHARLNDLVAFRHRALKAAVRVLRPDLRPILSGDADAIERLEIELDKAKRLHERLKAVNLAIRLNKKAGRAHQIAALLEQGFTETQATQLLEPDFAGRVGVPDYALKNNNAKIRQITQRIEHLQQVKATPVTETQGVNGIRFEDDPPANRVRLFFPDKPSEAIRSDLKKNGFRWTPSLGAWQAYRNHWSLQFARKIAGVQ